jgi:hypothetical protein
VNASLTANTALVTDRVNSVAKRVDRVQSQLDDL